jgi:subtilisin family serine protease
MLPRIFRQVVFAGVVVAYAPGAAAQHPEGTAIVGLLGERAQAAFAPAGAPGIGAVVRLPSGTHASDLGLTELVPGFARLWGDPSRIVAFTRAHAELAVEVSPPLHLLLDTAGMSIGSATANSAGFDGSGVLVGIADTGIDPTHPDFLDASGGTRVAWLLDLSSPPRGTYPDLEQLYGSTDSSGKVVAGAVWAKADIDKILLSPNKSGLPQDEIGHGTLVAACAAGNDRRYRGVAPAAGLLVARIAEAGDGSIGNDELMRGAKFLFDRADFMQEPVVVNLSIGTDFGPHDGSLAWEQTLAGYIGDGHPGHALVAAAGNSGSIVDSPVHQNVHVSSDATIRVPIHTDGADNGTVQVWVAMHQGTQLAVGLDGPDGSTWIAPLGGGQSAGAKAGGHNAAVYNGSSAPGSQVPANSQGAIVAVQGQWQRGSFAVTLSGQGTADLYLEATGDALIPPVRSVGFLDGVREATINLPATHPQIIGVGCTINKPSWLSVDHLRLSIESPALDATGLEQADSGAALDLLSGEPCWFSSAGPTLTGVAKPEIMAPGAAIVGALSQQAVPPVLTSIFTTDCPATMDGVAPKPTCQQVDALHGVSLGTSFSAPLVSGAVALLFEHDPTLKQDQILAALQGGAHRLRAPSRFDDQAGAGELDVMGALSAVDRLRDPQFALPARSASWMTLGADVYLADGSTPLEAVVELRAGAQGSAAPEPADGFDSARLVAYALVDGVPVGDGPTIAKHGPGVWVTTVVLPAGLGGSSLTIGARFDGADIVDPHTVPIATDVWNAGYPPNVRGGCAMTVPPSRDRPAGTGLSFAIAAGVALACKRKMRCASILERRGA